MLKDGQIVERGKHEELLSLPKGVYAGMWNQQLENDFHGDNEGGGGKGGEEEKGKSEEGGEEEKGKTEEREGGEEEKGKSEEGEGGEEEKGKSKEGGVEEKGKSEEGEGGEEEKGKLGEGEGGGKKKEEKKETIDAEGLVEPSSSSMNVQLQPLQPSPEPLDEHLPLLQQSQLLPPQQYQQLHQQPQHTTVEIPELEAETDTAPAVKCKKACKCAKSIA